MALPGVNSRSGVGAVLILGALVTFLIIDTTVIYQNTLESINIAYDRTLLASARDAIGDTVKLRRASSAPRCLCHAGSVRGGDRAVGSSTG